MNHCTVTSWSSPYTFSGKEKGVETGYGYFGARYYDSGLSIWLSADPMSDKFPNMSPYNYCANNPKMRIDLNGKWIWQSENYWLTDTTKSNQTTIASNTSQTTKKQPSHGAPLSKEAMNSYLKSGNPEPIEHFKRFLECILADLEKDVINTTEPYFEEGGRNRADMMATTWVFNSGSMFINKNDIRGNKANEINILTLTITFPNEKKIIPGGPLVDNTFGFFAHLQQQLSSQGK
ncbi:MAG: hypothetical protein H6Q25_280 [Bacteroidetes bacterium]|nr:hypothetical protein [Bacteroidota bacterium]